MICQGDNFQRKIQKGFFKKNINQKKKLKEFDT